MGFKDMSPGMKELYKLLLEGKIIHGGNSLIFATATSIFHCICGINLLPTMEAEK